MKCDISDIFKMLTFDGLHASVTAVYRHTLLTWRSEVTLLQLSPFRDYFLFFIRSQKVVMRDSRLPLALADPPPPYFLCITGLAAYNRWLSLFSSPQSRPGQVLCYLPERKRGRVGSSGLMLNFTPHGLGISETWS